MQSSVVTNETLLKIVERLENAVSKLEGKSVQPVVQAQITPINVGTALLTTEKIMAYTEYWNKTLKLLLDLKAAATETGAPEIEQISEGVVEAICAQQDVLIATETFKKPVNNDLKNLQKKLYSYVVKIDEVGKTKRDFALHADAAKNGLDALNWLYSDDSCDTITQTFLESIDFPGNKIFMKKIPTHTKWVKTYKSIIGELNLFVKANHKSGLIWASKGDADVSNLILTIGNTYRKNFKQQQQQPEEINITPVNVPVNKTVDVITTPVIPATPSIPVPTTTTAPTTSTVVQNKRQAESRDEANLKIQEMITSGKIRSSLKPIIKPEKKEESKQEVVAPKEEAVKQEVVVPVVASKKENKKPLIIRGRRETILKKGKKEVFEESRDSFLYENLEGEIRELDPEKLSMKTTIQINNCFQSTFKISKKVKKIILTNCEEVNIICDSLITIFEIINSLKIKVQVDGNINCFSIDGSTDITIHLALSSAHSQFVTSNSIQIRVRLAKEEDPCDYTETLLPEQLVFSIKENRKLDVKISDNYNY
jgi:adenylyl cyclase-associated protein